MHVLFDDVYASFQGIEDILDGNWQLRLL